MGVLTTLLYKQTIYKTVRKNKIVRIKVGLKEAVVQGCSVKKDVLRNFAKGLQLYQKRDSGTGIFCEF